MGSVLRSERESKVAHLKKPDGRARDHEYDPRCDCPQCTLQAAGGAHGRQPIVTSVYHPRVGGRLVPCIHRDATGVEIFVVTDCFERRCPRCPNQLHIAFLMLTPPIGGGGQPLRTWVLSCRTCRHQWEEHDGGKSLA